MITVKQPAFSARIAGLALLAAPLLRADPAGLPYSSFDLQGFATLGGGTTGGGVIPETDAAYRKCATPLEFVTAIRDSNKKAGAVKVIEITADLDLGWNEIDAATRALASTPIRCHTPPKLHPTLIASGVSLLDIAAKSGLTVFSTHGTKIKHVTLNIKKTSNIIIRNLKFDEMWEWDETTKGDYDSNDWDFMVMSNGGAVSNVWIDHCTFTKAYDGIADIKKGTQHVTFSWCRYVGDDGATNPKSHVRLQIAALEADRNVHRFYDFLRTHGFSEDDIVRISQGHDKGHLMGATGKAPENSLLSATFHHQWFQNVWDRCVPRLRGGQVHNYNILVDDSTALAARRLRDTRVRAMGPAERTSLNETYNFNPFLNGSVSTEGGAILVERSIYQDCLWPLRNNQADINDPTLTGKIKATDTIHVMHDADGKATTIRGDSTDAGNPLGPFQAAVIPFSWNTTGGERPYPAPPMDDPADLPRILAAGAGAGVLHWPKENWLKTRHD
jgi:pectate lyase